MTRGTPWHLSPRGPRTWTGGGTVDSPRAFGGRPWCPPDPSLQPWAQAPTTHPGAEVDLEDGAVAATTEHVMLGQVHGHGHDAHVKEHGQQQLARGDLPQLGAGGAWGGRSAGTGAGDRGLPEAARFSCLGPLPAFAWSCCQPRTLPHPATHKHLGLSQGAAGCGQPVGISEPTQP